MDTTKTELLFPHVEEGQNAPDFTLNNQKGESINLYTILDSGQKVLLVFYPANQTPGCTKQLCGIRDVYQEYTKRGVAVLGINKGTAAAHQNFIDSQAYQFDILVDEANRVTDSYGAKKKFFKNYTVKRGVFLIGTDKKVIYRFWGQHLNERVLDLLDK